MITFDEWLQDKKYQKSFKYQCFSYYNSSFAYQIRKDMELEDFKQHMYLKIYKYWHNYTGEVQADTYTNHVIKVETIRENKRLGNNHNKALFLDNNCELDRLDSNGNKIELPCEDKERTLTNEAIDFITEGVKEQDRDICKLYLMGVSMKDIEKFTDFTWKQIRDRCKVKYSHVFKKRYEEFYGLNII